MAEVVIFSTPIFRKEAKKELSSLFKTCIFRDLFEGNFILTNKESKVKTFKRIKEEEPIFVHNVAPVDFFFDLPSKSVNSEHITEQTLKEKLLKKKKSFAIECVTYKSEIKSRDIEVQVGSLLEKNGFIVNRNNPQQLLSIIIQQNKGYVGSIESDLLLYKYLDPSKRFSRESNKESRLNRAQFKLIEAIERFDIKLNEKLSGKQRFALDLGAAPGGWSKVLSSAGFKVIAIDGGELDSSLKNNKSIIHLKQTIKMDDINYIKNFIKKITKNHKASIITNDMNISPYESSEIMLSLARYLDVGGIAIMTLKSTKRKVMDLLKNAENILKKEYRIVKIKHLEQNRRELTLYLKRK